MKTKKGEMVGCPACGGLKVIIAVNPRDNKLCPGCFGEGVVNSRRINSKGEKITVRLTPMGRRFAATSLSAEIARADRAEALHVAARAEVDGAWAAMPELEATVRGLTTLADVVAVQRQNHKDAIAQNSILRQALETISASCCECQAYASDVAAAALAKVKA